MTHRSIVNLRKLKQILRRPDDSLSSIFKKYKNWSRHTQFEKIRKKIIQKNLIWHFCTPKSASSYLAYLLKLNTNSNVSSIPHYGDRQQTSDFSYLSQEIERYKFNNNRVFNVNHQHTVCDSNLVRYISEKHIVIIQSRNIYKTILSYRDFIISHNKIAGNFFGISNSTKYNEKDLLKLIIFNYVPFHVNFIKTWVEREIRGKKIFINYENFIKNEKDYLEKIFSGYEKKNIIVPKLEEIDRRSILFNIGTKRENTLTIDEKKLIDEIVDVNTKNSDPMIKSLIYQN
tara:strand:+ start:836 stop:1696 length:861 start_codon:yes stop_codon:yes gene_type:complete